MKNILTAFVGGLLLAGGLAFYNAPGIDDKDPSLARVDRVRGLYVFFACTPVQPYEHIGTKKIHLTWSGRPEELFEKAARKCQDKWPDADALIFSDSDMDQFDAVKFKND